MPEKAPTPSPAPPTSKKRKQSPSHLPSSPLSPYHSQSTIPTLFFKTDRPTAKRPRSKSSTPAATPPPPPPITQATMLNFPTISTSTTTTIDLTGSPPARRPPPFQPHTGARKLQIKNLRKTTRGDPEAYFNATWGALETALEAVFAGGKVKGSLEELYRGAENVCRGERGPQLAERLKGKMEEYVRGSLKEGVAKADGPSPEEMVKAIEAAWTKWNEQLGMIRSIFLYLDRSYLLPSSKEKPIEAAGLDLFRQHIVTDPAIMPHFLTGIFALFEHDRRNEGQTTNLPLLLSCIKMISSLGMYTSSFEPQFIVFSRSYFARLGSEDSATQSLPAYLHNTITQLENETARCDRFHLEHSTKRDLIAVIEDELIGKRLLVITDKASVGALLKARDTTSLTRLYTLLSRVCAASNALRPAWESYISTAGTEIVHDEERSEEMVPRLLQFKHTLDSTHATAFKRDETLGYALREAFSAFINSRRPGAGSASNSKPAEMVAKFVDHLLRTGTKGLPATTSPELCSMAAKAGDDDAQLAIMLEWVLDLFRFIQGKDVFEAFYKKDLARRLLMGRSASADAERMMISKLKTECGAGFTHNLESMFKDVDLSREAVSSFKSSSRVPAGSKQLDLYVNVLSAAAWPTYPEVVVNVPQYIADHTQRFQEFYVAKHSGRKLVWRHNLAHCTLRARFDKGDKELVLSAFQAVVLLLFNDVAAGTPLSFGVLLEQTGLPVEQLQRTLQSLACAKHKVLLKSPRGREVAATDRFVVNAAFTDPKYRVKVNQIQLKETKEENRETLEGVVRDRQYETQAAVIRVMKGKKKVRHAELVAAVIEGTRSRGMLDVADIKKNIERLIDKEYMERVEDNVYVYLA